MTSKTNNGENTLFILVLIITVASIAFMPVYAQYAGGPINPNANVTENIISSPTGEIIVKTDLHTYNQGDTIIMTGKVNASSPYSAVTIRMLDPNSNLLFIGQLVPASDGSFTKSFQATGQYWKNAGNYTIQCQYGSTGTIFKQTFHYNGGDGSATIIKVLNGTYPLQLENQNYNIPYIITGGTVSSMSIYAQQYTLEIALNTNADGSITVTIPRSLLDAKSVNTDISFIVTDGVRQITQFSETTNQNVRILSIPVSNGDSKIDIIGTQVESSSTPTPIQHNPYLECPDCNDTSTTQQKPPIVITVTTDKPVYDHNSQIMITGHVVNPYPGRDVTLGITSPSGNVVSEGELTVDNNGDFVTKISTVGNLWFENGPYRITVQQGDEQARINSTFFELAGESPIIAPFVISVSTDKPSYNFGDTIIISGTVADQLNVPISIVIRDSSQDPVYITEVSPGASNTYTAQAVAGGTLWKNAGTYEVDVNYGGNGTAVRVFQFSGNGLPPTPPVIPPTPSSPNEIDMTRGAGAVATASCVSANNCFSPNPMTVMPGTTVTWKNTDFVSHYVTSGHPTDNTTGTVFDSGNLIRPDGGTYQFTFANPGTYNYFCTVHPWMTGQVIVGNGGPVYTPNQSSSIFTPTQQDIQNINQAKANQTIAAEVNIGTNQSETQSIDNKVSVQTTQNTPDSLGVKVSATNQTGPKVIAFNLAATTINVANLKDLGIMYDGKLISPAPNMDAILHAKPTDNPSFAIVVTQSGVQVLVLVPHFSTHTITIINMSKVIPAIPEFPFSSLMLIIAILPIILISKIKLGSRI